MATAETVLSVAADATRLIELFAANGCLRIGKVPEKSHTNRNHNDSGHGFCQRIMMAFI
jgi:hypothetical protein